MTAWQECPRPPRLVTVVVLVATGLLTVACTPQIGPGRANVPGASQVVEVTMRDHRYTFDEEKTLRPGRVELRVRNQGESDHDLALAKLPDDVNNVSEWLEDGAGGFQPVYVMADRAPSEVGVFAAELPAGHYGMLCLVADRDGTLHYELGMVADFRVGAAQGPTQTGHDMTPN